MSHSESLDHDRDHPSDAGLPGVVARNQFYQDNYYCTRLAVFLLLIVNFLLIFMIVYKYFNPPHPVYFPTTPDGRMIVAHALKDPLLSDDRVLQWSTDAVRKSFSLDYEHWRAQLQDASENFTPDGWRDFKESLKSTNNLKTLTQLKMVSDIQITGAPKSLERAVVSGHFAWKISMPLLLTYTSSNHADIKMLMNATVIVLRMPETDYPQGIALNNFIAQPVTGMINKASHDMP